MATLQSAAYPPGYLRITATHELLDYEIFEVSACTLGVVTQQALSPSTYLHFETIHGQRIPMQVRDVLVVPQLASEAVPRSSRVRLLCLDSSIDLERILRWSVVTYEGEALQFARVRPEPKLYVDVKPVSHAEGQLFETINLSRSGLLLQVSGPTEIREGYQQLGQYVYLKIDVARVCLPFAIEPVAQVSRIARSRGDRSGPDVLALQFVEFAKSHREIWHDFASSMERQHLRDGSSPRSA